LEEHDKTGTANIAPLYNMPRNSSARDILRY
jgi:hypothetical protein